LYDAIFGGGSASTPEGTTVPAAKDGMKVGAKPQLVLVGEGGEEEWIIPKSKLAWWLGASESALNLFTFGAFPVFNAVRALLSATGAGGSVIPADVPEGSSEGAKPKVDAKKPESISSNFGDTLFGFFKKGIGKLKDKFVGVLDKVKSFLPDLSGLPDWARVSLKTVATAAGGGMVMLVDFLLGGGGAQAATVDTNIPDGDPTGDFSGDANSLADAASELKGLSSRGGPDGGRNACVWAVNKVFAKAGIKTPWGGSLYVPTAEQQMIKAGYQQIPEGERKAGDIYITAGQAHVGIVLKNGNILSNSSSRASFAWEGPPSQYNNEYGGSGRYYRIPQTVLAEGDKNKKENKPPTATPPVAATPPKQQTGRAAAKRRSDSAARARREARAAAPPVAPLNKKDTASALEKFGTMDEDNNQQVAVIEVPVTRTEYVPMPLPFSTAGRGSVSNTPAWGQGAVLGA